MVGDVGGLSVDGDCVADVGVVVDAGVPSKGRATWQYPLGHLFQNGLWHNHANEQLKDDLLPRSDADVRATSKCFLRSAPDGALLVLRAELRGPEGRLRPHAPPVGRDPGPLEQTLPAGHALGQLDRLLETLLDDGDPGDSELEKNLGSRRGFFLAWLTGPPRPIGSRVRSQRR